MMTKGDVAYEQAFMAIRKIAKQEAGGKDQQVVADAAITIIKRVFDDLHQIAESLKTMVIQKEYGG